MADVLAGVLTFVCVVTSICLLLFLIAGLRVIYQYERGLVFRLGKFQNVRGPGLTWINPILMVMRKMDLRIKTIDVPKQEVITRDNITVQVNAFVYYKIREPEVVYMKIENFHYAIQLYTQAALRDIVGGHELDYLLGEREKVAENIQEIVIKEINDWGIDIVAIKMQEIEMPDNMKRAMAKQAEAERVKRATIIASEGELQAAENLREAAQHLELNPISVHLRTLQTIRDISPDPSQKIVLFLPGNIGEGLKTFLGK